MKEHKLKCFSAGTVSAATCGSVSPERRGRSTRLPASVELGLAFCARAARKVVLCVQGRRLLRGWALIGTGIEAPAGAGKWYTGFPTRTSLASKAMQ